MSSPLSPVTPVDATRCPACQSQRDLQQNGPMAGIKDRVEMSKSVSLILSDESTLNTPWPLKMFKASYQVRRGLHYRAKGVATMKGTGDEAPQFIGTTEAVDLTIRNESINDQLKQITQSKSISWKVGRRFKHTSREFCASAELSSQTYQLTDRVQSTFNPPRRHSLDDDDSPYCHHGRDTPTRPATPEDPLKTYRSELLLETMVFRSQPDPFVAQSQDVFDMQTLDGQSSSHALSDEDGDSRRALLPHSESAISL
ncbi:hypothetical protein C8Q80DRAFT_874612 [Daedaleopsis nitida]|nr:hypothetical protein C8Q80DRAFT_874612 [Daedaleopsis nitida]